MNSDKVDCPDEYLESIMHQFKRQEVNIMCPSSKKITKLCTNIECKNALRCGDQHCKHCCKEKHAGCISIPFE